MTRDHALRRAQKVWGKRAAIRANDGISSPERRERALMEANSLRERKARLESEIVRLEQEAGIPALREQVKALAQDIRERALGEARYYRFEAGFIDNIIGAFHIKAQGDTWEEVFAKAELDHTDRKQAS